MTPIDLTLVAVIAAFSLVGFAMGLARLAVPLILALVVTGAVQAYPEVVGRVGANGPAGLLLSLLLVAIIALLVTGFLSRALKGAIAFGQLGWLNRAAGFVAGTFLGCVLAALAVKVLSDYGGPSVAELLAASTLAPSLLQFWVAVTEFAGRYWPQQHEVPWWRRWF